MQKHFLVFSLLLITCFSCLAQSIKEPSGKLFIIGGGDRSPALIEQLIQTAELKPKDYIVVLPMSSAETDTSFYYIKIQLEKACKNTIVNLNFTANDVNNQQWLDSLQHARLIFITGGDQSRFMKIVLNTPIYKAIHEAFNNGATVAGSSAGAAVMSRYMITGNQLKGDSTYHATFDRLWMNNIQFTEGLGLLDSIIIDQHFIVRNRYNRLLSALSAFPHSTCIGIDEATAIIVHHKKITVAGDSQVLVFKSPKELKTDAKGLIKMRGLDFSIYTARDSFQVDYR